MIGFLFFNSLCYSGKADKVTWKKEKCLFWVRVFAPPEVVRAWVGDQAPTLPLFLPPTSPVVLHSGHKAHAQTLSLLTESQIRCPENREV